MKAFEWYAQANPASKATKLFEAFDVATYNIAKSEFLSMSSEEKQKYKNAANYFKFKTGLALGPLQENYYKIVCEHNKRFASESVSIPMPIDANMQDVIVFDLLRSIENIDFIKAEYKRKKLNVSSTGLNTSDAENVLSCITQGRSLLEAGKKADSLTKPLIYFYSASAYAYAIIVMNSPLHKSIDSLKGSHGHSYNHDTGTIDFGGSIPSGTFLDLLCAISMAKIDFDSTSFKYSLTNSIRNVQASDVSISVLSLLSMIPEMRTYYVIADSENRSVYELEIRTEVSGTNVVYEFIIGNGKEKPPREKIVVSFPGGAIRESDNKWHIKIQARSIDSISPSIYQDLYGKMWFIDSPLQGFCFPEYCVHFLTISALCNIMRYSPYEWNRILTNKISSEITLLINNYLRVFEQKFPLLVIQLLSNYRPFLER